MRNVLAEALDAQSTDEAIEIIVPALGITDLDVARWSMPRSGYWSKNDREGRAAALAEWLSTELKALAE